MWDNSADQDTPQDGCSPAFSKNSWLNTWPHARHRWLSRRFLAAMRWRQSTTSIQEQVCRPEMGQRDGQYL